MALVVPHVEFSKYGWQPQSTDTRDLHYTPTFSVQQLPNVVDLRSKLSAPYDQKQLGSCSANAAAKAFQYQRAKQGLKPDYVPSRLEIYYFSRMRLNPPQPNFDSGAIIRDAFKSMNNEGVCSETLWPYSDGPVQFTLKPDAKALFSSNHHKAVKYEAVLQDTVHIQSVLAENKVVVFGFLVYESFESQYTAQTGLVSLPKMDETCLGGHAMVIVGYQTMSVQGVPTLMAIVANSWGPYWGDHGYCYMPFAYLCNPLLASDFWTIDLVNA